MVCGLLKITQEPMETRALRMVSTNQKTGGAVEASSAALPWKAEWGSDGEVRRRRGNKADIRNGMAARR